MVSRRPFARANQAEARRIGLIGGFWAMGWLAVLVRLLQLQVAQHARLLRLSQDQHLGSLNIAARRGPIHDRNGTPLAISVDVPSIAANPHLLGPQTDRFKTLAHILKISPQQLTEKLQATRYFVWLKRHVSPSVEQQVIQLGLKGVDVVLEPRRFYPNREVAAHVLGFAGMDARGLEGIERQFDEELLGEAQTVVALRDARGVALLQSGLHEMTRSRGVDLHLSIDVQLAHAVQTALLRVVRQTQAKGGMAVIMQVSSGQILAMEMVPGFNPNEPGDVAPAWRRNRAVTDLFEPGSTLKPLVMAAALDHNLVSMQERIDCEHGSWQIGKHLITDVTPHRLLGLTDIIARSSNIGMAKIGARLGADKLHDALMAMGFGQKTGIELPYEAAGILRAANTWSTLDTATIAFGQGVASNLVQLAAAYRALAADGMWCKPTLLHAKKDGLGHLSAQSMALQRRLFSVGSSRKVSRMLQAAVEHGTGKLAQVPGYRVAGKTGTAQKAVEGAYSKDRYLAMFAGYVPADKPEVVVVVTLDEPVTNHYGGVVAAPLFAEIAAASLRILGVLPSQPVEQLPVPASQPAHVLHAAGVPSRPLQLGGGNGGNQNISQFIGLSAYQAAMLFGQSQTMPPGTTLHLQGTGVVIKTQWREQSNASPQLILTLQELE